MNWGKGIVMGMAAFMLFIIVLSTRMITSRTDDYDRDYYEQGLNFDAQYQKERQVLLDNAKPLITLKPLGFGMQFKNQAFGTIHFIRQADRALDKTCQFKTDAGGAIFLKINLPAAGRWQVVTDWKSNEKAYLDQQEVWVP